MQVGPIGCNNITSRRAVDARHANSLWFGIYLFLFNLREARWSTDERVAFHSSQPVDRLRRDGGSHGPCRRDEFGRASCWERVFQSVYIRVIPISLKNNRSS